MAGCPTPALAQCAAGSSDDQPYPVFDRRNTDSRDRLIRRIRSEFSEMPCLRLTEPQSQRLFGLRDDVCRRLLTTLVDEGLLWQGHDGRYGMRRSH